MKQMIAYCGLDCEKCDAYIATKNNDDKLRQITAKKWAELNNAPITPEMINCEGCRVDGKKTPFCESMCLVRQCARKKQYETCADCEKKDACLSLSPILCSSEEAKENLTGKNS